MTLNRPLRRALLAIVALFLLWLAWTGLSGGINQWPQSRTPGQIAQTITQLAYGPLALLSLVTTFWAHSWHRPILACWTVSLTLSAGLASVVWGGTSVLIGCLASAATLLIALATAWLLRVGARGLTSG
jgi:hypothetical protein